MTAPGLSIPERFQTIVQEGPDRLAVRSPTTRWTYGELDAVSSRIAHALLRRAPDTRRPVLLFLETDAPLLAAMLGVLKAGLFYVPVDPGFPPERAAVLASLAGPSLVVTRRGLRDAATACAPEAAGVIEIDGLLKGSPEAPPLPSVPPESFAYVLFTSGSTGTPKGMVQTHRNVLANAARLAAGVHLNPEDRITLLTSASYGASVSDIYGALLHGAAVLPFDPRSVSPGAWRDWAAAEGITIWHSVPGLFRALARAVDDPGQLPVLRLFKIGGEPVTAADLDLFRQRFRVGTVFHVGLGMTELNVVCQWFATHDTACPGPVTPVGQPGADVAARLLGPDGEPTDQEEAELALVSTSLSPGYWGRPDLTAQAFQPAPGREDARLFRTSDLVRKLPSGDLLHLGRRDRQLKIRGVRVDAAEVEAVLRALPGVRDVAVDARPGPGGERALAAWIVAEGASPLPARSDLAAVLPPEAVPSWIMAVPELPTLGPGKIDRDRLPDPPMERRTSENPFVTPATPEETFVAAAFAGALGLTDPAAVGALDDFFALGGTSILSLDVLLGLERSLGRPVDAAVFLEDPTPRGIARRLATRREILEPLTDGQGDPVFFIPGHGGGEGPDLLQLARIARRAALPEPVLAFRLPSEITPSREALLERWTAALLERQSEGPWKLVAFCAGGSIGFSLAARLSRRGEVRLILHDALFPNPARRLRRFLRRLREPWGDDLLARLLHHLREARRQGLTRAFGYLQTRAHSATAGIQRMSTSTVRQMVGRQDTYLRLAFAERPAPWPGEAHLIVTPNRKDQDLPRLWRTVSPRLKVRHTGADAEGDTAAAFREILL